MTALSRKGQRNQGERRWELWDGHCVCSNTLKGNKRTREGQMSVGKCPVMGEHHPYSLVAGRSSSGYEKKSGCVAG